MVFYRLLFPSSTLPQTHQPMPTAIHPSNSPPRSSTRTTRSRRAAAEPEPPQPAKPSLSSSRTRPIRNLPRSRRVSVCIPIPSVNLTRKNSANKPSSSHLTRKSNVDSSQCTQSVQAPPSPNHGPKIKKPLSSSVRTATRLLKSSESGDTSSSKLAKKSPSRSNQSTSTRQGKTEKLKKLSPNGIKATIATSDDLDPSQLDEIEEKITSTSNMFSEASVQDLNSKTDDSMEVDFMTRVDERCFEVLKNSELDDRSDQSDEELIPSDHEPDQMDGQPLPSSFQSPRRLSSVSPLGAAFRTKRENRRSARKSMARLSNSPKGALTSEPTPKKGTKSNNQVHVQEAEIEQEGHFQSDIILPLLHGLLSHLSGIKPLPIRIPKHLRVNRRHTEEARHGENDLNRIQSVIDLTPCLVSQEELELELRALLFRSISQHEGNVLLLCGARGSGKTALVSRSLSLLSDAQTFGPDGFITIKLNGLIHSNDKIALKEMCRQLFSRLSSSNASRDPDDQRRKKLESFNDGLEFNDDSDFDPDFEPEEEEVEAAGVRGQSPQQNPQPKFSNYGEVLKNLLDVLEPSVPDDGSDSTDRKALVIVLENFDMFLDLDRQSFLYCLLDSVQGNKRKNGICVIGTTSGSDCLDRLEKRVKSRCQSRIRYLNSPSTEPERIELIKTLLELFDPSIISELSLSLSSPSTQENQVQIFVQKWNDELDRFLEHSQVLEWLRSKFDLINDPLVQILQDLHTMVSMIAYEVKRTGKMRLPILKPIELYRNTNSSGIKQGKRGTAPERRIVRSSTMIFSSLPWWSHEMSTLEFSVLIACKHLSSIHHNGIFNLEMAWDLYRQHLKRHALAADHDPLDQRDNQYGVTNVKSQIYGRDAFELAWERLKRLEIIVPISMLNSRMYTTTPMTHMSSKIKKYLNASGAGGGGGGGKGYELVKFVPFLTQIDLVISQLSNHFLLANHLLKWSKNSTD